METFRVESAVVCDSLGVSGEGEGVSCLLVPHPVLPIVLVVTSVEVEGSHSLHLGVQNFAESATPTENVSPQPGRSINIPSGVSSAQFRTAEEDVVIFLRNGAVFHSETHENGEILEVGEIQVMMPSITWPSGEGSYLKTCALSPRETFYAALFGSTFVLLSADFDVVGQHICESSDNTAISWRGDGSAVVCATGDAVYVFDTACACLAHTKLGYEVADIGWLPQGSLISIAPKISSFVALVEPNLQERYRISVDGLPVRTSWESTHGVLSVLTRRSDSFSDELSELSFWNLANGAWFSSSTLELGDDIVDAIFHPSDTHFYYATSSSAVQLSYYISCNVQGSFYAFTGGDTVHVTDMEKGPIPHPLSHSQLQTDGSKVMCTAISARGRVAVSTSSGDLLVSDIEGGRFVNLELNSVADGVKIGAGIEKMRFQLIWLDEFFLAWIEYEQSGNFENSNGVANVFVLDTRAPERRLRLDNARFGLETVHKIFNTTFPPQTTSFLVHFASKGRLHTQEFAIMSSQSTSSFDAEIGIEPTDLPVRDGPAAFQDVLAFQFVSSDGIDVEKRHVVTLHEGSWWIDGYCVANGDITSFRVNSALKYVALTSSYSNIVFLPLEQVESVQMMSNIYQSTGSAAGNAVGYANPLLRRLPRDCELLATCGDKGLVLVHPRGNFELISPAFVSYRVLFRLLSSGEEKLALDLARRNRIDANVVVDWDPHRFDIQSIGGIVASLDSDDLHHIVSHLENVDSLHPLDVELHLRRRSGAKVFNWDKKVEILTHALLRAVEHSDIVEYSRVIMTCHLVNQNYSACLFHLKRLQSVSMPSFQEEMRYLHVLIRDPEKILYSAIQTYDMDVVRLVAPSVAHEMKVDVRELLLEIEKFEAMPDHTMRLQIDLRVRNHRGAAEKLCALIISKKDVEAAISQLHDLVDGNLELMGHAVELLGAAGDEGVTVCKNEFYGPFADILSSSGRFNEAAEYYSIAEMHELALKNFKSAKMWDRVLDIGTYLKYSHDQLESVATEAATYYIMNGRLKDAESVIMRCFGDKSPQAMANILLSTGHSQELAELLSSNEQLSEIMMPSVTERLDKLLVEIESILSLCDELMSKLRARVLSSQKSVLTAQKRAAPVKLSDIIAGVKHKLLNLMDEIRSAVGQAKTKLEEMRVVTTSLSVTEMDITPLEPLFTRLQNVEHTMDAIAGQIATLFPASVLETT